MISQERLNRITKFVEEMALVTSVPTKSISKNHLNVKSPGAESGPDWMAAAIPVDHAVTLAAAAAGIISDEEAASRCEYSPGSGRASDASDQCQTRDLDKDGRKDCTPDTSDICNKNQSVERSLESLFR